MLATSNTEKNKRGPRDVFTENKEIIMAPLTFDKSQAMLLSSIEGKMAQSTDLLQGSPDPSILKTLPPGKNMGGRSRS